MKFVFYIINLEEGTVEGTNDLEIADLSVEDENYVVLHQNGSYWNGSREMQEVESSEDLNVQDEDEEEEE